MASPEDDEDDLDERLARVFEERGVPFPAAPRSAAPAPAPVPAAAPQAAPAAAESTARTPPVASRPTPPAAPRSTRREKTMLLGLLGTLAGAFAGVLSMKLFVPRPPTGTGPDVHLEAVAAAPLDIVEPPALTRRPSVPPSLPDPFRSAPGGDSAALPATAPPRPDADGTVSGADGGRPWETPEGSIAAADGLAVSPPPDLEPVPEGSRFAAVDPAAPRDPFAGRSFSAPAAAPAGEEDFRRGRVGPGVADRAVSPAAAIAAPLAGGAWVVREGDTWWDVAEAAYGDGRLYKALFAWNRTLDPRTSLTPGSRLEVPDESRLRAAWGRLVPDDAAAGR